MREKGGKREKEREKGGGEVLGEERGNRYCVAFQLINCALYMNIFSLPHNNNNNAIKEARYCDKNCIPVD